MSQKVKNPRNLNGAPCIRRPKIAERPYQHHFPKTLKLPFFIKYRQYNNPNQHINYLNIQTIKYKYKISNPTSTFITKLRVSTDVQDPRSSQCLTITTDQQVSSTHTFVMQEDVFSAKQQKHYRKDVALEI